MSENHSPLPWAVDPDHRPGYEWNYQIISAENPDNRICFMTSDGPSEANAELIVRAVNTHAALVEALEKIATMPVKKDVEYDKRGEIKHGPGSYGPDWAAYEFQRTARAALARRAIGR